MDNKRPQFSVYAVTDVYGNYMGAVSTEGLKDKVIKENEELKGFVEIKVNDNLDEWLN